MVSLQLKMDKQSLKTKQKSIIIAGQTAFLNSIDLNHSQHEEDEELNNNNQQEVECSNGNQQ
jgi:hypothetical protein